ncbi:MAG: hypothetical protein HRU19_21990 [Pseudobacteriovorax sp.]|nr:hypothetical protein [Pseudobacteriovorax sp.]
MFERLLKIALLAPLVLYGLCAHLLRAAVLSPGFTKQQVYQGQVLALAFCLLLYLGILWLTRKYSPKISWIWGALLVFVATILIPTVMQTDQYRYIWNGSNLVRGLNPYDIIPLNSPEFKSVWWVGFINFPELPTIYPAFAELVFGLSSLINPYFWDSGTFYPGFAKTLFQVEFGWSVVVGLTLAFVIYLLRHRSWWIVACNPLFLICAIGNKHIEILLLPFILLLLNPRIFRKQTYTAGFALGLGIAAKWLPIIILPLLAQKLLHDKKRLAEILILAFGVFACLTIPFMPAIYKSLATSTQSFSENWVFFPYLFLVSQSIFGAQHVAFVKGSMALIGLATLLVLVRAAFKAKKSSSLQFYSLWLLLVFVAVSPVINPWYLLPLLVVGVRYWKVLMTPIIWPACAFFSQYYYVNDVMPWGYRVLFYGVISLFVLRDLWVSRRRLFHTKVRSQESDDSWLLASAKQN